MTAKLSSLNQYATLLCYPLLLHSAHRACVVSFPVQSIFLSDTILCLCIWESNWWRDWWKNVFFSHTAMYEIKQKAHTNTLLFTGSCRMSHGMTVVSRGWMVFGLLTENGIPPRTERWQNTLLPIEHDQSFDHHVIRHPTENQCHKNKSKSLVPHFFPVGGKEITFTMNKKVFSLPIMTQR